MSTSWEQLAAYLEQRRRLGEPGIVPTRLEPRELVEMAASSRRATPPASSGEAAASRPLATGRPGTDFSTGRGEEPPPAVEDSDYRELRDTALSCTRCRLSQGRTQVAFSDGNPKGRLVVVGEAPGAREDATGRPFVGQAGKLLDLMLASVGMSRKDSVYICNVLKCRPPGNRNPLADEIDACSPFLKRQIALVSPEAILAVGSFAAQWLTESKKPLGKLRGTLHGYEGVPLVVTYHPAALLRNPAWSRLAWDDLQLLLQVLNGN